MSRAWGTKPSPTGIKASIQEPFVPILIGSTPASPPSRVPRAAQRGLTFPPSHPHQSPTQSRWPQTQGQAHLFFLKGPVVPAGSGLGPVLSGSRASSCGAVAILHARRGGGSEG